ncbi:MAG: DUF1573 domain-containing protein [Firmicutes bacterium]|nr:DUF1573 domain-containing protein [Bacillota bacterium]
MKEVADCTRFQQKVEEFLIRHRSILDVLSKYQESNARVNRSVIKAVTNCGFLKIRAERQPFSPELSLVEISEHTRTHVEGALCEYCREVVETELGNNLFYLEALCNLLDSDLLAILEREYDKVSTLGKFNLS